VAPAASENDHGRAGWRGCGDRRRRARTLPKGAAMSRRCSLILGLLLLPAFPAAAGAAAAAAAPDRPQGSVLAELAPPDTLQLRQSLEALATDYRGVAGISVRNLATGESLSIRGHETYPSASLIKVPILVAMLDEVHAGRMHLDERATMIGRDRVGGSGVLRHMQSGIAPTLEDLAWLMITISDNTATNLILDKIDVRTVWTKMEALGLPHSKVHSKTFRRGTSLAPDSSVIYGLGVTTPDETVRLFELLHHGRAVSPALDSLAMQMLFANQDGALLTRWLPSGTRVAHKSGSVDRARNDCGIMYTPAAPIAVCVMTRENEETSYAVDNPAHLLVAHVARAVFRHYNAGVALPPLPAIRTGT
jgi:beta-lactamase class A